ncbi:hypothetical protein [Parvularcula dongshanensis]|nr:hypothetical protein [Parvularcula dongshanensis]
MRPPLWILALCVLAACETYYIPVPDWNGDGKGEMLRIPTTSAARCEVRDADRASCISDCNERYLHGSEPYGRCVARCDAKLRACGASSGRRDPAGLSQAARAD